MKDINSLLIGGLATLAVGAGTIFYDVAKDCRTDIEGYKVVITARENPKSKYMDLGLIISTIGAAAIGLSLLDKDKE